MELIPSLEHCNPQTPYTLTTTLTSVVTSLDVITDVMSEFLPDAHYVSSRPLLTASVASIPIIILRKTQLQASRKVGLSILLGLSLVMATVAVIRLSGFRVTNVSKDKVYDLTWQIYWQYMEGCIGCIMVSIATFRALFVTSKSNAAKKKNKGPSHSFRQHLGNRLKRSGVKDPWEVVSGDDEKLPAIPSATLLGMRTYIRRNNRSAGQTTELLTHPHEDDHDEYLIRVITDENKVCLGTIFVAFIIVDKF